ncbi:MAG: GMP synthase [Porticoccaceae bacterium]
MTTLGLLETDILYDDLLDDYGSYGQMFAQFFDELNGGLEYRYYQVQQGELPQHPDECDAYLITGSKAGVYDPLPWMAPLQKWIADFHRRDAKLTGICFGHQIIAHSLGGYAEESTRGWGVGVLATQIQNLDHQHDSRPGTLQLIHSHRDQVVTLPPEATRLAGSDFCPNAAMALGNTVLTFQGHPEFTPEYFQRLIGRRREQIGEARYRAALESLEQTTHHQHVGQWLLDFINE